MDTSPVEVMTEAPPPVRESQGEDESEDHERQREIQTRFGTLSGSHHASLDRFHVTISDVLRPPDDARPIVEAAPISINLSGNDVFVGLKKLAELGSAYVDLSKVPSWMTGEMNVSSFSV
jgi:hypothetical protein